ncbi:UNVERIFIED_CONTAM: hypothetical protein GTU68_065072, partial [Idotea baltica]|nr:hypothetical protein [Idotea baltica]
VSVTTNEIREAFLSYFEQQDHTRVDSSSLLPAGDPTLLFVNAGMVQFKDSFLGAQKLAYTRATTCQKCLRISGKHNDLENVGRTARHHTFFEMLGNFSFGDYFKEDAVGFAWSFVTEVLKLPKERLWVTIFENDDEAEQIWQAKTDIKPSRILRCGEKDNFWAMGDTGPCGDDVEGQSEEEFRKDDGTYVEIWNLVFMQFNRSVKGELENLPKPSVDTGMGLERVAAIMQGKRANYDSDIFRAIIAKNYAARNEQADEQYAIDVALRVIADHARSAAFLIADGVTPSSDGRGYVLRRLIRRACRHGRVLGFNQPFLFSICAEVVSLMSANYPELKESSKRIARYVEIEEKKFLITLETGMGILEKEIESCREQGLTTLSGSIAFQLHDTYGFPLDLTQDIVAGDSLTVDVDGFAAEMDAQRQRSRGARSSEVELILQRSVEQVPTTFVGYENSEYESCVLGLFTETGAISSAKEGMDVVLVAEQTPFYSESGGQIGDTGTISAPEGALDVLDTQRVGKETIVHICKVLEGTISNTDKIRLSIDEHRRARICEHHSATHILHYALRTVLGVEVKQAGSRVADRSLRFDCSYPETISRAQLDEIEDLANDYVRDNYQVVTTVMPLEEAKKIGAMALFGEKYDETVRVVQIGEKSKELCGGTHVERSGDIGRFKIVSESSVSAGVRRIEAVVARAADRYQRKQQQLLTSVTQKLQTGEQNLLERVSRLIASSKELESELERVNRSVNLAKGEDLLTSARELADGSRVITGVVENTSPAQLREMADDLRSRIGSGAVALAGISGEGAILLVAVSGELQSRLHAGKLMKEIAPLAGGRGGGKAELAQAGGADPKKVSDALRRFEELVV